MDRVTSCDPDGLCTREGQASHAEGLRKQLGKDTGRSCRRKEFSVLRPVRSQRRWKTTESGEEELRVSSGESEKARSFRV